MKRERGTLGFTLLELLIVVIIIGILAAVALPQFSRMTRRSRFAEAMGMLDGIATAELAYYQENNTFCCTVAQTNGTLGGTLNLDAPADVNTNWDYNIAAAPGAASVTIGANGETGTAVAGMNVTIVLLNDGSRTVTPN